MPISPEELARRLEEAVRVRRKLREATRALQAAGDAIRKQREAEPRRPDPARDPR
ncbi:MAG: hypothetical protein FJ102_00340 [Deltaproteobacteria bacterium]|nr:hypothetical protein [Deltaproteobacteria bacterium]